MEVETKYIAPRSAPFVALMQAPEVGGYHLEPMPAVTVRDVYLDTATADLLRQGFVFRVREQDGDVTATLKSLGGADGALHRRLELEAALGSPLVNGRLPLLPDGDLRETLDRLVRGEPLQETVRLRQYRTPRVAFDGPRLVGILSLDVVAQETRDELHIANEVEVELAETGREEDLYRLDPVLRARGLEPTSRSKFERALLRVQEDPAAPLMLLPDERAALERYQESGTPLHRRRARVVLLTARGLRPTTIANKAGLSPSRVQHWVEAFRARRLAIFTAAPEESRTIPEEPTAPRRPLPSYRVSELVSSAAPRAALFRSDHFAPDPAPHARPASGISDLGDDAAPDVTRHEEVESARTPAEAVPPHAFGDGAHVRSGELAAPFADAPATPAGGEDGPSDLNADLDSDLDEAIAMPPAFDDEPPESAERAAPEPEGPEPKDPADEMEGVESLDDLLDLFDAGPAATPHLTGRDADTAAPFSDELPPEDAEDDAEAATSAPAEPLPEPEAMHAIPDTPTEPAVPAAPARALPRRPRLSADEPVLAACERVLRYHVDGLAEATARLFDEATPPAVRKALIAAHRVRIALEVFADYLPPRTVRRLHRGLRGTARALDALGDLDLVLAYVTDARASASAEERAAFDAVLSALGAERRAAWQSVAHRLRGALHTQWLRRAERLLGLLRLQVEAGLTVGDHAREEPDDYLGEEPERPTRDRLRYMLGSTLWDRYEAIRAYDAVVGEAGDERLHPLGVACSALQFALGLAAGCAAGEVRPVARPLSGVESHLALLHHVRLAADALAPYVDAAPVRALRDRLQALHDEALAEAPSRWEAVAGTDYRERLARVVASI